MNGYQVCQLIKRNPLVRGIQVIMLTGKDGMFDKVRGRLAGAAAYMTKPFTPAALLAAVEKHAGPATAPAATMPPPAEPSTRAPATERLARTS
jgi:DNA-binding response OmpR family regulator